MLIYGEFGAFVRLFECFGLLINGGSIVMEFYFEYPASFGA